MNDYLFLKNLTFAYDNQKIILDNISISINKNETIGLIGCNGAGKSTFLKLLVGLISAFQGTATVDGLNICKENYLAIRQKLGLIMQSSDNQLFMPSVREEIAFAPRNYGWSEEKITQRIKELSALLNLEGILERPLYKISGGEKKLTAIAAIIVMEPDMLLMDEPTNGLDPKNRRHILHLLKKIPQGKIIASHDLDFIADTCERVILLDKGRVINAGNTLDILQNESLLTAHNLELPLRLQGWRIHE
ncbi:energy-coupling factor ABC transporter ATP-binding protein [Anaerosinus sp.]|uniref:energy-coupling factor ABC transporter ATP-binding protein n=1 Tax=Selenobaculum sp. TaxID=3074374 RepID=UPI0015B01C51